MPAIAAHQLSKRYGARLVVDRIDLSVASGEVFGFLGSNGVGKSTTIKMLCTLVAPTGGTAHVAGYDITRCRDEVRRKIGIVFQESTLDPYLTVRQNLRLHAQLFGIPRRLVSARVAELLAMLELEEFAADKVKVLSGGIRRRAEIARGLLHLPRVLFLDEPTTGLDPHARSVTWSQLDRIRRERDITIFLTTHYMDEAEHCDRIAIMNAGRIVAQDTPAALKSAIGADQIQLSTQETAKVVGTLRREFDIEATAHDGNVTFEVADGAEFLPALLTSLRASIRSVNVARPTLDDVFLLHTGHRIHRHER